MPDTTGCEMARHLRAGDGKGNARLICVTVVGDLDDRRRCIDADFGEFFTEPMLAERLTEVVAEANEWLLG
jgi:CheY-like chemotaxis protein